MGEKLPRRNRRDPNGSHVSFLSSIVKSVGSIAERCLYVEIGAGFFSTTVLRQGIGENGGGSALFSLENNDLWQKEVSSILGAHPTHKWISYDTPELPTKLDQLSQELKQHPYDFSLVFIDCSPWESRTLSLKRLVNEFDLVLVHDSDYFPSNKLWGEEIIPIIPRRSLWGGYRFGPQNVGFRDYSDVLQDWFEVFPKRSFGPTGPPLLVGSNRGALKRFDFPAELLSLGHVITRDTKKD